MTGALFAQLADVRLQTVQFRGGGEAAAALLGGHAKFSTLSLPNIVQQVRAGQAKALAVTSYRRTSGAGDIPTAAEAGLPGLVSEQWLGMMAPAQTPQTVIERIGADVVEIVRSAELLNTLRAQGAEAAFQPPLEFAAFMAGETLRLKKLIEATGLRAD